MRNSTITRIFVFVLILNLIIPLLLIGNSYQSKLNINGFNNVNIPIKTQSISKDDFSPLIENRDDDDLGNITINNMDFSNFDELGFYLNDGKYPTLHDDYNDEALNMTFVNMEFIETIEPAIKDNVLPVIKIQPEISVKLNETIDVSYNSTKPSSDGFLIYGPRLYPCEFVEFQVQKEGSPELKQVNSGNYSIDKYGFLRFNYASYFPIDDVLNFTMYIVWNYNISIIDSTWGITQDTTKYNYINNPNQDFELLFAYNFNVSGYELGGEGNPSGPAILANGIAANFSIIIPDRNLLTYDSLIINSTSQSTNNFINNDDKSIFSGFMELNNNHFFLNFTAEFSIAFVDTVGKFWAIDRLVSDVNVRERIYLVNITSGPKYISITWFMIQESAINKDQVITSTCLFENRDAYVNVLSFNRSEYGDTKYISDNPREREWINITLPFFIKNEICPFIIRYKATEDLKIGIYDNIGMPLIGLGVVIDYQGEPFGTYISKEQIQPLSTQTTDINAEIVINNVPMGEYVIHVYQYGLYQGSFTVNSYVDVNSITTGIIHFPVWILIFGLINLSILAIGYNLYRKKKLREQ